MRSNGRRAASSDVPRVPRDPVTSAKPGRFRQKGLGALILSAAFIVAILNEFRVLPG